MKRAVGVERPEQNRRWNDAERVVAREQCHDDADETGPGREAQHQAMLSAHRLVDPEHPGAGAAQADRQHRQRPGRTGQRQRWGKPRGLRPGDARRADHIDQKASSSSRARESSPSHWAVENSLHRVMDMVFRDDECRVRTENAPANFAIERQAKTQCARARRLSRFRSGAERAGLVEAALS
jgi:hypothetical protein